MTRISTPSLREPLLTIRRFQPSLSNTAETPQAGAARGSPLKETSHVLPYLSSPANRVFDCKEPNEKPGATSSSDNLRSGERHIDSTDDIARSSKRQRGSTKSPSSLANSDDIRNRSVATKEASVPSGNKHERESLDDTSLSTKRQRGATDSLSGPRSNKRPRHVTDAQILEDDERQPQYADDDIPGGSKYRGEYTDVDSSDEEEAQVKAKSQAMPTGVPEPSHDFIDKAISKMRQAFAEASEAQIALAKAQAGIDQCRLIKRLLADNKELRSQAQGLQSNAPHSSP